MNDQNNMPYDIISEADIRPVLELLQGGDPDAIAKKAGITKEKLFQMRDDLLAKAESRKQQVETGEIPGVKVGRNDPCPCGSGKKYKRCCMEKHEHARKKFAWRSAGRSC